MSLSPLLVSDTYAIPRQTQTAGTAIVALVPPRKWKRTKASYLQYTSGATQHTITLMKELSRTKAYAAVAGGATTLILAQDPGLYSALPEWLSRSITPGAANNAIAANDYIAYQCVDGTWEFNKVSAVAAGAVSGTVSLTVTAVGNSGIAANTTVYFFGVAGDTDPHYNRAHSQLKPTTSATTTYPSAAGGAGVIEQSYHMESPLLVFVDNPTAAGVLDYGTASYGT